LDNRMSGTAYIISGGYISDVDFIRRRFARTETFTLICADSGARYADRLGVTPQVIVGDMDSLDVRLQQYFEGKGCIIIRHPKDKDETDTQLALEYALITRPSEVVIFGALGGRLDHTLANVALLMTGVQNGVPVKLVDEWCEVFLVTNQAVIDGEAGQTVSIFPYPQAASGVSLDGFEYPLADGVMETGRPFGISNRLAASRGVISVKSGYLLVIRYFKAGEFP
jgi:thiamine pyrophosphokinase